MLESDESNLDDFIIALHRLQALKIEHEYDVSAESILLCTSYDAMREVMDKRDHEIAMINAETEKELVKYKAKS